MKEKSVGSERVDLRAVVETFYSGLSITGALSLQVHFHVLSHLAVHWVKRPTGSLFVCLNDSDSILTSLFPDCKLYHITQAMWVIFYKESCLKILFCLWSIVVSWTVCCVVSQNKVNSWHWLDRLNCPIYLIPCIFMCVWLVDTLPWVFQCVFECVLCIVLCALIEVFNSWASN